VTSVVSALLRFAGSCRLSLHEKGKKRATSPAPPIPGWAARLQSKVLPAAFAGDPDRMARFQREARVLASLNHPNIAAIYGVEDRALIMEPVEGKDLRGPLPVATALHYAGQIAGALDFAHEKGIVHRDLKPANITPPLTLTYRRPGTAREPFSSPPGPAASTFG